MSLKYTQARSLGIWNTLMTMFFLNEATPAPQEQPKPNDPNKDKQGQDQQQQFHATRKQSAKA